MSSHTTLRCYYHILNKIREDEPSKKELMEYLRDRDFKESERTIERYIEHLRYDFGMEIKYEPKTKSYAIGLSESLGLDDLMKYLEMATTAELIAENLKDAKETLNYIDFDGSGSLKGIQNITTFLTAVREQRWVKFDHFSFEHDKSTFYEVQPYLLKEYEKRWYLVGIPKGKNSSRTFGIERIENIKVTDKMFKRDPNFRPKQLFRDIVGLVYSESQISKVILKFGPKQSRYVKSLPLHFSQEILEETKDGMTVALYVRINYELVQQILRLGETVEVLEPKELVNSVRHHLLETLKHYS